MKLDAFIEKLNQLGAEWIIDVEKYRDTPTRKKKNGQAYESSEPNPTGTTIIKKWPANREWCNQCNQLVKNRTMRHKFNPESGMWRHKCSCGKLSDICMSCVIDNK